MAARLSGRGGMQPEPQVMPDADPARVRLTTLDVMALVAGCAVALVLGPIVHLPSWFTSVPQYWSSPEMRPYVLSTAAGFLQTVALAGAVAGFVVLARVARLAAPPRPAEWLALSLLASAVLEGLRRWADPPGRLLDHLTGGYIALGAITLPIRPASVGMVIALIGLLVLARADRRLGFRGRVLLLGVVILALRWGPVPAASAAVGPSLTRAIAGPADPINLYRSIAWAIAWADLEAWFDRLLYAIPCVAAVLHWRRRDRTRWGWAESIAAGSAGLFSIAWLLEPIREVWSATIPGASLVGPGFMFREWMIRQFAPWSVAFVLATLIVVKAGPRFHRWIDGATSITPAIGRAPTSGPAGPGS